MNGKQLKNSILQWAIQGKLVPQDPNDEPASVLLERIRKEKARLVKEGKIRQDKNESVIFRGEDNSYYEKFTATGQVRCIDDEVPFEIPRGWEWCRMGKIISLLSGRDLEPSQYNSMGIGIPYLTGASNFSKNILIVNRWTKHPVTISQKDDLLITCKGTIGTTSFNTIGDIHIARQIMAIKSYLVSLPYIRYFLMLNIQQLEKQANSMIPGISREVILNFIFPLPPLKEQRRIVAKIEELQPYIERYSHAQDSLDALDANIKEQLRKSILQEAIQGRLVPQLPEEGTAEDLLSEIRKEKERLVKEGKLKKSALTDSRIFKGEDNKYYEQVGRQTIDITEEIPFELPNAWGWIRLGTLFMHNTGKALNNADKKGSLMPYITTSNLYWGRFELDKLRKMYFSDTEVDKCTISKGDLLICEGGDVGRAAIWDYNYEMRIQNHIHKLRSYVPINTKFYFYVCFFYKSVGLIGGKGIGIQGLSAKALDNLLIPIPPIIEQSRIVFQTEHLFEQLK